jgi:biotin carboxyl carrier protein
VLFPDDAPGILRPEIRAAEPAPPPTPATARSPEPEPAAAASSAPAQADTTREFTVEVDGEEYRVRVRGAAPPAAATVPSPSGPISANGLVQAPMQGMVVKVKVIPGATVKLGDVVVVLEAMKMQNDIAATANGTVREVFVKEGTIVAANDPLLTIG